MNCYFCLYGHVFKCEKLSFIAKTFTDDTFKNHPSDSQSTAVTSREILFVVIIFIGLLFFLGLLHVCRKRQRRILVIPLQNKEIQADNVRQHHIEERIESVYDEIDESAMSKTVALSSVRPSLHSSYLDVTNSQCYTMDTKDTDRSTAMAKLSTQSEPVQKTSQPRQRHSLEINIKERSIQREEGNEYSDGYLRPMFLAEHNWFDKMSENKGKSFSNKKKMTEKVYDKPTYDGISISVSYDRLISAKSVGNQIYGGVRVNNPIYPTDDLLDKNLKQSKCTSLASKRKTI
ncbi:Hypothetical predicted protein [Mytilus galloprovincialis]|uniref:Uncharacterized protein n=1 Tax=Mytilus galloprovincialis TaxID=29158 RepID=A0A8B6GPN8_MYTGA|nr:Hypothetical predicted protein [Mytilus galloprovincialis]